MTIKNITSVEEFEASIRESEAGKQTVVDFWAAWCGPCRALTPVLEKMERDGLIDLVKVDVDANPELSQQQDIKSIPTMLFYKDGTENAPALIGAMSPSAIRQHLNI